MKQAGIGSSAWNVAKRIYKPLAYKQVRVPMPLTFGGTRMVTVPRTLGDVVGSLAGVVEAPLNRAVGKKPMKRVVGAVNAAKNMYEPLVKNPMEKAVGSWDTVKNMYAPVVKSIGDATVNNPNKYIKWTSRMAAPAVGVMPLAVGAGSFFEGRRQGLGNMYQTGQDAAEVALDKQLQSMPWYMREIAAADPSVMMTAAEQQMPGTIKNWETQTGKTFKPGLIGSLFNQNKGPSRFVYDNADGETQRI